MKIVFMGTPEFAVPSLDRLINSGHDVVCAVCQPDRDKDNKGNIIFPAVKRRALESGIKVLQFEKIRTEAPDILRELAPDIAVTVAYGQILSQEILDIPKHGIINVHASLLPKYRGSSPVQRAIIEGERETGVTIMQTAAGLDTGDIISVVKTKIEDCETAEELLERLSVLGANLLIKTLSDIENGQAVKMPQDESKATKCPMIKKADGLIDWNNNAAIIRNFIHGMNPWPLAHSYLLGKRYNIFKAELYNGIIPLKVFEIGEICVVGGGFVVACGGGTYLRILEAQAEGKKRMDGDEILRGLRLFGCDRFTNVR